MFLSSAIIKTGTIWVPHPAAEYPPIPHHRLYSYDLLLGRFELNPIFVIYASVRARVLFGRECQTSISQFIQTGSSLD